MKAVIFSLLTGGVAAQFALPPNLLNIAVVDTDDAGFRTCTEVASQISSCVNILGGTDALQTADPLAVVECACCDDGSALAPAYSACSDYLSEEGGSQYRSEYIAYGDMYSACALQAECSRGGSGGGSGSSITRTGLTQATITSGDDDDDSPTITSISAEQTYATACVDMVGVFNSCSSKIDDFTDLPFPEQAACYCCRGRSLTWTDQFDKYAKTCASWARTGEPETAYSVARTFATFCEQYTDACDGAATATTTTTTTTTQEDESSTRGSSGAQATDDDNNDNDDDNGPVTVTVDRNSATETSSDNAAPTAHVAMGAAFVAAFALARAL